MSGGEMQGTLGIKLKTVGEDLENRRNLKLCNSGSYTEVTTYSKECVESYAKLKKLYDEQREQLGDASIEIQAYTQALKKMSVKYKIGLGFKEQVKENELYNEASMSVFDSHSSDIKDAPVYDRFAKDKGMHAVSPPITGNYMPLGPDIEIDESQFTYETLESVPEPVVNEPKIVCQPKVWFDAPIIEEYESDSDDDCVITTSKEQEKPSFAFVNTSKRLGLGYGFTRKACFVCGSFSHLIRDCDFHEKRMVKQVELNKRMVKGTGQRENRLLWNNVQRVNHQNQFVPTTVLTKTSRIPVNTARYNFKYQAVPTSAAKKVNTIRPMVNDIRPKNVFHKAHSPIRRPFNRATAPKTNLANQKVNTAWDKAVSVVGGIGKTDVKPSADCIWRPKIHYVNKFSKYNGGSNSRKCDDPHKTLKSKGIVDSGCSRHMTRNKAYLAGYQDYNGGPVAFGGSIGYITGKGKIKTRKLDFEDVSFVKELQHFNLFSVSQMCDKKNKVLFTDTECLVLSPEFKLPDENQLLLRIPRKNNMYSFNLENIVPIGGLACLIAKATIDESNKWHRRLGHVNFKTLNKLVKGNLIRGLPSKIFQNDQTCVACQKGKQHKAYSLAIPEQTATGKETSNLFMAGSLPKTTKPT
ncbi:ribonuclease H-like domain-containing protein [Tanacetum coccineum]